MKPRRRGARRQPAIRSERALTAWLAEFFPRDPSRVSIGIGDDAAMVRNAAAHSVVSCDPVVEGVHFAPGAPPLLVARKAVNRNLADLAAMGAVPDYLVVSVLLPRGIRWRRCRALFTGLRDAAAAARCLVVGGDVSATPGPLVLTVTAIGHLESRALRRDAVRAGDTIFVTGPLGGAALGAHLRFRPPLAEGRWLARQRGIGGVIDVSDGLLLDLQALLLASGGLGAQLFAERIPVAAAAWRHARRSGRTPLEHALSDGEDHVLLFTRRRNQRWPRGGPLRACARQPVGVVTRAAGLWLVEADGGERTVEPAGYEHRW